MPALKAMSEFKSWAVNMLEHTEHMTATITYVGGLKSSRPNNEKMNL
jgi:hypothetical protein